MVTDIDLQESKPSNIYWIKGRRVVPDIIHPYTSDLYSTPIVIDNGSYNCRVGWASDQLPRLSYRNCYAKQRKDRGKKNATVVLKMESEILVANDIANIESVRFQLKSQHDENVVTHFEAQEMMLDYAFSHLGIDSSTVDHPIVMTEAMANPVYSRQCMSELLFECYGIPKVAYCVDGLTSYYHNCSSTQDGLIINIGNYTSYIMPIIDGQVIAENTRRIRIGAQHLTKYLWRWLQLRYPQHLNAITVSRAESLLYNHVRVSSDFTSELESWSDPVFAEKNATFVQLPFSLQPVSTVTAEQLKERKREAAKRLADVNAKKREEKLEEDEQELRRLIDLEEAMEEFNPSEAEYLHALEEASVASLKELRTKAQTLRHRITKTRNKIAAAREKELSGAANKDDEIEEEAKWKRLGISVPVDKEARERWLDGYKQQWREVQQRKAARKNRRQEMARRGTAASQERMRIISQLARRDKKEDTFGTRDEDWDVYKAINKDGGGSDSEEDDDKQQELSSVLKRYCPEFLGELSGPSRHHSTAENYQLFFGNEKIRIGEILFQPSICGLDQGGLTSTIEYVLQLHSPEVQSRLVDNILVTGGGAKITGLIPRIEKELRAMRPFQSSFNVRLSENPQLDAWLGARDLSSHLLDFAITKNEYEEFGPGFTRKHKAGNDYWRPQPPPAPPETPAAPQITK